MARSPRSFSSGRSSPSASTSRLVGHHPSPHCPVHLHPSRRYRRLCCYLAVLVSLAGLCGLFLLLLVFYYFSGTEPAYDQHPKFIPEHSTESGHKEAKLILMWTKVFREEGMQLGDDCPLHKQCEVSYDRGRLAEADALVFHIYDLDPSQLPNEEVLAGRRVPKVFLSQESAPNLEKYSKVMSAPKNYFHWTMTFLNSSTIPFPYGSYWLPPEEARRLGLTPPNTTTLSTTPSPADALLNTHKAHPNSVFWLVSNCHTVSQRERAIAALSKHIPVDIAGACRVSPAMAGVCPRQLDGGKGHSCNSVIATYPFFVVAENSICRDYITEKYWDHYHLPSVPIVMRRDVYERRLPTGSFIAMSDFAGPAALARHLLRVAGDPVEYAKYFEWRNQGWALAPWQSLPGYRTGLCRLCEKLVNEVGTQAGAVSGVGRGQEDPLKPIPDAAGWFRRECDCDQGEFVRGWLAKGGAD